MTTRRPRRRWVGFKEALSRIQEELSLFKETKAVLNRGSLTLEQAAEEFVKAKEAEIRARAEAEFKGLRKNFEVKMPRLVYQKLLAILKKPPWPAEVARVIDRKAEEKAQSKLDDEFQRRVNEEAWDSLQELKSTQWRPFLQAEASRIGSNLKTLVAELQGTWRLTCDRCHRTVTIEVGPREIAALLKGGRVAECPRCTDLNLPPAPLVAPHKINGSALEDLLEGYLAEKGPPGEVASEPSQKESHPSVGEPTDKKQSTTL